MFIQVQIFSSKTLIIHLALPGHSLTKIFNWPFSVSVMWKKLNLNYLYKYRTIDMTNKRFVLQIFIYLYLLELFVKHSSVLCFNILIIFLPQIKQTGNMFTVTTRKRLKRLHKTSKQKPLRIIKQSHTKLLKNYKIHNHR